MRGPVLEDATNGDLFGIAPGDDERAERGTYSPRYSPIMTGAIAEDDIPVDAATQGDPDRDDPPVKPLPDTRADNALVTGTVSELPATSGDAGRIKRAAAVNQRAEAVGIGNRRSEDDPYAPLGIRAGTFIVTPTLEQGSGWTSNASSSADGEASFFSETALRLNAMSDWSRHSATLDLDGTYRKSISGARINEFEGGGRTSLRQELGSRYSALYELGYRVRPETASSPVLLPDVAEQPLRHSLTGGVGIFKDAGKLRLGLRGEVVREIFGDADLADGGTLSQEDRNSTLATTTARVGYFISPAFAPFIEAEIGRRIYDLETDSSGYDRSANRLGLRTGVEIDLDEKLQGEIAAGWLTERPDDDRLEAISAPYAEGRLTWSPVRGTIVELVGSTTVEGSTTAGETGSVLYANALNVSHVVRDNLTAAALIGFDWRDYAGTSAHEYTMRGEASLTWWMNRYAGLTGRARHETRRSNLPDRDYSANSVYLGLTLQR